VPTTRLIQLAVLTLLAAILLLPAFAHYGETGFGQAHYAGLVPECSTCGPLPGVTPPFIWANVTAPVGSNATAPIPRFGGAMAFDPADQMTVLFGGQGVDGRFLRDTWAFGSGHSWSAISNGVGPPGRMAASLAYNGQLHALILFGGKNGSVLLPDTWAYNTTDGWVDLAGRLTVQPPLRAYASMSWDPALNETILYGGRTPNSVLGDTWAFNGSWHQLAPASSPGPRFQSSLAFDTSDGYLVLFGGLTTINGSNVLQGDTWIFTAGGWSELSTNSAVSARAAAAFAFDPTQGGLLLFGGLGASGTTDGDTWLFQAGNWTQIAASPSPPGRGFAMMATSPGNGTSVSSIVLYGGQTASGAIWGDTWIAGRLLVGLHQLTPQLRFLDVGQFVNISVQAFGGIPPYSYAWAGQPTLPGCASADQAYLVCHPSVTGTFWVNVTATGSGASGTNTSSTKLVVNPLPAITSFTVTPFPAILGEQNISLTVKTAGGTGAWSYFYSGLPAGCNSVNAPVLNCAPARLGTYTVEVTATDAAGVSTTANVSVLVQNAPTAVSSFLDRLHDPVVLGGIGMVAVFLVLIGIWAWQRRRVRRGGTGLAPTRSRVPDGDKPSPTGGRTARPPAAADEAPQVSRPPGPPDR
jgi:hypothetical protein